MIKEALQYIIGMDVPHFQEFSGQLYADKDMRRLSYNPKAEPIQMTTLTSLVEYIKSDIDSFVAEGTGSSVEKPCPYLKMMIHVKSPTLVELYSPLDAERRRESMVVVNASVPKFPFNEFMGNEEFIIGMQAKFIDTSDLDFKNNDKSLILKFAGSTESGTITAYGDDGVTQKATIKTGIASKSDAIVPNPVRLVPYRTFNEVIQPASDFIFRMKERRDGETMCGIFEADGGAWKNDAMQNIKDYLIKELEDYPMFKVIS